MHASNEIERFFAETLPELASAERTSFDEQAGPKPSIVVYGCGTLGRKLVRGLREVGEAPVAFVDGDRERWGATVEGLRVYSLTEGARLFGEKSVAVVTIWSPGEDRKFAVLKQQISAAGFASVSHFLPLFWKHAEILLPHYRLDLPSRMLASKEEVLSAYALLQDGPSQAEFMTQLRWMLSPDVASMPPGQPIESTYFPEDLFTLGSAEQFVDCGAYDGDTLKEFLKRTRQTFEGVVAYEPDPQNFQKLRRYIGNLPDEVRTRIRLEESALGEQRGIVRFAAMGSVSSSVTNTGSIEVQLNTLDENLGGAVPTYIKMDIEGAEIDALRGGRQTIREHQPKLAVCVYHLQNHLWRIPLQIHEFCPHYQLYLRRYQDEFGDVVCYAIPPGS